VGAAARVLRDLEADAPRTQIDPLVRQLAATLALELAAAGATLPPLSFEHAPARVACLGGRFVVPGGAATLSDGVWTSRSERRSVVLAHPEHVERPYTPIEGGLVLATFDDNPISMFEAHPDKEGNAIDLGGRDEAAWCAALRDALVVIEEHLPLVREEIEIVIAQLVPVGADDHAHLSASYREAIGTIYLTLHPRTMTMVEALIHEHGHNKLNALFELDPVLDNAFSPLFTSPVRPDPRPLHGILLAVHAFLPVAVLYRSMMEAGAPGSEHPDFHRRFAQIVRGNREGVRVLVENAAPTPIGRALLDEIAELDARFERVLGF
jgi:HEXXH motif-containing protein